MINKLMMEERRGRANKRMTKVAKEGKMEIKWEGRSRREQNYTTFLILCDSGSSEHS
jgi:hypothetical protein